MPPHNLPLNQHLVRNSFFFKIIDILKWKKKNTTVGTVPKSKFKNRRERENQYL